MSNQPAEGSESRPSEDQDAAERDSLPGEDEGIELTMGEPSSFEPEEDPGSGAAAETD